MKLTALLALLLPGLPTVQSARGGRKERSVSFLPDPFERKLGTSKSENVNLPVLPDQCIICSKTVNDRPTSLTVKYSGGTGSISRYQDATKATCRDQTFPVSGTFTTNYGDSYSFSEGAIITITGDGGEMDANTVFDFGNGLSCTIHTSCSQPLVGGDTIGPFLILEGNDCTYEYCGDGIVQLPEQCDDGEALPTATCRDDCTIPVCGDGIVDPGEECETNMPDCRADCTYPPPTKSPTKAPTGYVV